MSVLSIRNTLPLLVLFAAGVTHAVTELSFAPELTELTSSASNSANKARIIRLSDGRLIAAWHEGNNNPAGAWGVDGVAFAPRDIFVRVSADEGQSWTEPVNVSSTSGLTDAAVQYDRVGDDSGLAGFYGDSSKPTIVAAGNHVLIVWDDSYCGAGRHGPARYSGSRGYIEVPYHCLYAARLVLSADEVVVVAVEQLTDAMRDVNNEVARAMGAGFAIAWQEDPNGLQLGEAYGEGEGTSGARASAGTDIWYTWLPRSQFADAASHWREPTPVTDNFDYAGGVAVGGGASRPLLGLAGSPPTAIVVYEEAKNVGSTDVGKSVRFHQFPFSQPPTAQAGIVISDPSENARRARVLALSTPGNELGTRMLLMWRQGEGIQGAPADFLMRVGYVPEGTDLAAEPDAGFRAADLWPPVDVNDAANNAPALNLSAAQLDEATSVDPLANAKAHRAVLDGDFIYAGYTQDADGTDGSDHFQYFVRRSADGGASWSAPMQVSTGVSATRNVVEPRLLRTPGTVASGLPRDIHDADVFLLAWGTEFDPGDGTEPYRDALYATRTMDRGQSFERVQRLSDIGQNFGQTDEQVQLRISPDGQEVAAVWVRKDVSGAHVMFDTARGIIPTASLRLLAHASTAAPDVGDNLDVLLQVENAGPQSATELRLHLSFGAGLSLTRMATDDGNCAGAGPVVCELDELGLDTSAEVSLGFMVNQRGNWTLSAEVVAWEEEPQPLDNVAELQIVAVPNADLLSTSAADGDRVQVGDFFKVSYELANLGPQSATDVQVSFDLPSRVALSGGHGCSLAGNRLTCAVTDLGMDETWAKELELRAVSAGIATIAVAASAQENDPVAANNDVRLSVSIDAARESEATGGGCVHDPAGDGDVTLLAFLSLLLLWRLWHLQNLPRSVSAPHA